VPFHLAFPLGLPDVPTTSELDPRDTVLYDGHCRFCTSSVQSLRRFDGKERLRYVSLHDPSVAQEFPDLTIDQMMKEMWVAARDGRRYAGADAIRYLSRKLPMLYPLAPIMYFPGLMPICRWVYRWVAENRYRIAGKTCDSGTCNLHRRP
jgi:predicted DCC family thiol-disulfide oxidoreductase YuxK